MPFPNLQGAFLLVVLFALGKIRLAGGFLFVALLLFLLGLVTPR